MLVIGVGGQAQNGKDSTSDYLAKVLTDCSWQRSAFARQVKRVYADAFGVTLDWIEEWKVKDECPPGFDMPVRKGLQFIGEGFRKIRPTIWIDLAMRGDEPRIISDCRYLNEFRRVKDEGGLTVLVAHPGRVNDDPCPSESELRPLAVWCLENMSESGPIDFDSRTMPAGLALVDYFVRNDEQMHDLYDNLDAYLIPYINSFSFSFSFTE